MTVARAVAVAFLAWGAVPALLAAIMLSRTPTSGVALAVAAFALAWFVAGVAMLRGARRAPAAGLLLLLVPWTMGVVQTVRRAQLVMREGGMERADGYGSPMAFALGLATEQLGIVLPLTMIGVLLWRAVRAGRREPSVAADPSYP